MSTPQYYAGLLKLVPLAIEREIEYQRYCIWYAETQRNSSHEKLFPGTADSIIEHHDKVLAMIGAGEDLARDGFYASFDDPLYGLSWKAHHKFHTKKS
jgi:hypothetical protein